MLVPELEPSSFQFTAGVHQDFYPNPLCLHIIYDPHAGSDATLASLILVTLGLGSFRQK